MSALAKLKVPRARVGLEKMTNDRRTWVRAAARKALTKLA
ncbi:hypothetical protein [Microbacterium endophyticum]